MSHARGVLSVEVRPDQELEQALEVVQCAAPVLVRLGWPQWEHKLIEEFACGGTGDCEPVLGQTGCERSSDGVG